MVRVDTSDGTLLFGSGQVAPDTAGRAAAPDDMTAQSHLVMRSSAAIRSAHGGSLADVVGIRTFVTDMDRFAEYGAVRRGYLVDPPPSSTTVEVPRLFALGALPEVEAVAAVAT